MPSRMKQIMDELKDETDPDKIQILELDLQTLLGTSPKRKTKGVKSKSLGGSMGGNTQGDMDFAGLSGDEVLATNMSRGGRKAIKGLKFKGIF
tara:strand:+ start:2368 stop:2646 length:279 start_codon:yes stop_codon:yes gene_type:complete